MIEEVKKQVKELLKDDKTDHGFDHMERVTNLAVKIAKQENANIELVTLGALLHDVDDYKLFGEENSKNLTNTKRIMENCNIDLETQEKIINIVKTIGYSKRLEGIIPNTLESCIVSDADMCDAIGAHAILRIYEYGESVNRPFFDKNIFPIENITKDNYKTSGKTSVNHFFEKLFKLKNLMLTESGKEIAKFREKVMVIFLNNYFQEENNGEMSEWNEYLTKYIKETEK